MSNLSFDSASFDKTQDKQGKPTAKISGHPEKEHGGYLEEVEKAPDLSRELEKAGVETLGGEIRLTKEARQVGVEEAAEATPVVTQTKLTVNLPLTEGQIEEARHQKMSLQDSRSWLVILCERIYKILRHKLVNLGR